MNRFTNPSHGGVRSFRWPDEDELIGMIARLAAYEDTGLTPEEVSEAAQAKQEGRVVVLPDGEAFVRCEDCIHGGWTDDITTHCNKWHTRDDPMCVGYLGFCGAGEKGEQLELMDAEAALEKGDE